MNLKPGDLITVKLFRAQPEITILIAKKLSYAKTFYCLWFWYHGKIFHDIFMRKYSDDSECREFYEGADFFIEKIDHDLQENKLR